MKLRISLDMGGFGLEPLGEAARILREVADDFEGRSHEQRPDLGSIRVARTRVDERVGAALVIGVDTADDPALTLAERSEDSYIARRLREAGYTDEPEPFLPEIFPLPRKDRDR